MELQLFLAQQVQTQMLPEMEQERRKGTLFPAQLRFDAVRLARGFLLVMPV